MNLALCVGCQLLLRVKMYNLPELHCECRLLFSNFILRLRNADSVRLYFILTIVNTGYIYLTHLHSIVHNDPKTIALQHNTQNIIVSIAFICFEFVFCSLV
jgi:hypothetical protein